MTDTDYPFKLKVSLEYIEGVNDYGNERTRRLADLDVAVGVERGWEIYLAAVQRAIAGEGRLEVGLHDG